MRTSVLTLSYHIIFMERLCIISLSFSPHLGKIDITKKKKTVRFNAALYTSIIVISINFRRDSDVNFSGIPNSDCVSAPTVSF